MMNFGVSGVILTLIILITLEIVISSDINVTYSEYEEKFEKYKKDNNVTYSNAGEEKDAFGRFVENYYIVKDHNNNFEHGDATFTVEVNKFADKDEDFISGLVNTLIEESGEFSQRSEMPDVPKTDLKYLNYTEEGCISPMKNQLRCGACYAFAITGSIEGVCCKKYKRFEKISEQQVVSCTKNEDYGNFGCEGGKISSSFLYLVDYGAMANASYPYVALDDTCAYNSKKVVTRINNFIRLGVIDEEYLKNVLAAVGPLVVAINASSKLFQFYKSGCFYDAACSTNVNHAMILTGFGTDPDCGDYWILKNFYGSKWGELGYMRMARGTGNLCGFLNQVFYPECA